MVMKGMQGGWMDERRVLVRREHPVASISSMGAADVKRAIAVAELLSHLLQQQCYLRRAESLLLGGRKSQIATKRPPPAGNADLLASAQVGLPETRYHDIRPFLAANRVTLLPVLTIVVPRPQVHIRQLRLLAESLLGAPLWRGNVRSVPDSLLDKAPLVAPHHVRADHDRG